MLKMMYPIIRDNRLLAEGLRPLFYIVMIETFHAFSFLYIVRQCYCIDDIFVTLTLTHSKNFFVLKSNYVKYYRG